MSAEDIANKVNEKINEILPELIKTILPNVLSILPTLVKELMPTIVDLCKTEIRDALKSQKTSAQETIDVQKSIDNFKRIHKKEIDNLISKREDTYYRYAKCEHYLDIYAECMQAEPLYVPKKFRKDEEHIVAESERPVRIKMEIDYFRSECEVTRIRRDHYTEKCTSFDNEHEEILRKSNLSEVAKTKLRERWNVVINEDIDRVNAKWKKKIASLKTAFEKDKAEIQKKRSSNEPILPSYNNINNNAESITVDLVQNTDDISSKQLSTSTTPQQPPLMEQRQQQQEIMQPPKEVPQQQHQELQQQQQQQHQQQQLRNPPASETKENASGSSKNGQHPQTTVKLRPR